MHDRERAPHVMRRVIASVVLLALLPLGTVQAKTHIDDKIRAQQAKLHAAHLKLMEKRAHLHDAKVKAGTIADQLDQTNHNIAQVHGRISVISAQMHTTQRKLDWTRVQLAAAQQTVARHNDALKRRLVQAYEHGDLGYIDVLLESRSFTDFVERWNDIRYIIKANEVTIRQRKALEANVHGIELSLVGTQAVLGSQQSQAGQEQNALGALADERKSLLQAAAQEKNQAQTEVQQYEEMTAEEEAALEALIREKQQEEERRREAERRARQLAGEPVAPIKGAPGTLSWPVSGPITSPFGMRNHPTLGGFRLHAGIDIGANEGTTIGAAASGRVIVAQWAGNCGNMVSIYHGGSMSTVYCHMSHIFVGVGQDVTRGQAIGAVGHTGDANGPHLHLGVLINGKPVDPIGYLR